MTIGERLKKEREKKGLTLDEVHSRLRIHQGVLSNLEQNNFQALPATIYTKGFLKRYSEFLEINAEEMLSEYDSLKLKERDLSLNVGMQGSQRVPDPITQPIYTPTKEPLKNVPPVGKRHSSRSPKFPYATGKIAVILVAAALAIFLSIKCYQIFTSWASSRPAEQTKPAVAAKQHVAKPAQEEATKAAPPTSAADSRYIQSPELGNFPKLKPKTPLNLAITASTDAWIRVSADGNIVFEAIMRPGQTKEWTAQKDFELKLGRPAGMSLSLNGYSLGSPDNGQAKQVQITRDGMVRLK